MGDEAKSGEIEFDVLYSQPEMSKNIRLSKRRIKNRVASSVFSNNQSWVHEMFK